MTHHTTMTAIIPCRNEARQIQGAIESLQLTHGFESIVVADGGSTDATCHLAKEAGAHVVHCQSRGRGLQVREAMATLPPCDVVVILHADARFPQNGPQAIARALAKNRKTPGGAFSMGFRPNSAKSRFIACLNHLRCHISGISFGDQCQFVRWETLEKSGGFPPMMLMEDVELSLMMKRLGRPVLLPETVEVSSRTWNKASFGGHVFKILALFFTYLIRRKMGVPPGDGSWYYRKYYT